MADLADLANQEAEVFLRQAIRASKTEQKSEHVAPDCIRCGEAIPKARQRLGLELCIDCAHEAERRQ